MAIRVLLTPYFSGAMFDDEEEAGQEKAAI
jgi:hypothetical protein